MKIEIDLNDIFSGEGEELQDSIKRQVIEHLSESLKEGIGTRIDKEIGKVISKEIASAVSAQMPSIIQDLINTEYRKVDQWGNLNKQPTTFRNELVTHILSQMKYEKKTWDSEKNPFTLAVDQVVSENMNLFKVDFKNQVTEKLLIDSMSYAVAELRKKLNLPDAK